MLLQSGGRTVEVEVAQGQSILDVIRKAGLPMTAPCSGKGTCGKCEVLVRDETSSHLTLACNTEAVDTMQVDVSDASAVIDLDLLEPLVKENAHGIALDLGTTTLAAELVDLITGAVVARAGLMNPQGIFGADVISRIEAAEAGHLEHLRTLIIEALRKLITTLCKRTSYPLAELSEITLAGNTIMQHIATGLSPASIGRAPYTPQSFFGEYLKLWEDLPAVWFAPCVSGYVGGDIVAGILLCEETLPSLLIDLGTNGELMLETGAGSVSAATAAGPVFEGMNIRYGLPALPGAIRRVAYDEATDTIEVDIIGEVAPAGICGSGLIDTVSLMRDHGLIEDSGRLLLPTDACDSPLASRLVLFEEAAAFKLLPDANIVITQKDIRNLQLAKAAIAAGIEIVLDTAGLKAADLTKLSIAGGFGLHIDKYHAARLGLIPKALLDRAESIGNSSLAGARKALLSNTVREHMLALARQSNYVELSTDLRFTDLYIEQMGFE